MANSPADDENLATNRPTPVQPMAMCGPDKHGIKYMIEGLKMITHWHTQSFACMPVGDGYEVGVNEFDFADDNGICCDKDGVVVRHWRRAHGGDGAPGYRLEWKRLSFVWSTRCRC